MTAVAPHEHKDMHFINLAAGQVAHELKPILRLAVTTLVAIFTLTIIEDSVAGTSMYSSAENWGFYRNSCEQLVGAISQVRQQIDHKSNVLFVKQVEFNIDRMINSLRAVNDVDRMADTMTECEARVQTARILLRDASEYQKTINRNEEQASRKVHEASPYFGTAKSFGYKDYDWLASVEYLYKKIGATKLKTLILVVDEYCGAHFKAIQRLENYTIFAPGFSRQSTCGGDERVAIIPARGVAFQRGEYIDTASYYVFEGTVNATAIDGFPTKVLVLKQLRSRK